MEIQLNKESFSYSRFCMHLRYLVQRMMHGSPLDAGNAMDSMFVTMRNEYPQVHTCVQQIDTFLHGTYGWQCSKKNSCTSSCISTASALSARRIELFQIKSYGSLPVLCLQGVTHFMHHQGSTLRCGLLWSEIG